MKDSLDPGLPVAWPQSALPGLHRTAFPVLFLGGLALRMAYTVTMTVFNITTLEWAVGSAMALGLIAAGFARQAAASMIVVASPVLTPSALPVDLTGLVGQGNVPPAAREIG